MNRHGLVVVPAHDEQDAIGACLGSVLAAVDEALTEKVLTSADVVVAAHRCTDATEAVARAVLGGRGLVLADEVSASVGEVRDRAVRRASAALRPESTWLLSTDADSTVPVDWVAGLLRPTEGGAVAVAGMTRLVDWHATARAREQYEAILQAGYIDDEHHRHVYAANLAVRLDAYLAVGGFPSVPHGEETGLLAALRAGGYPVTSTRGSVVATSGRMPGRAALGLGNLLARMNGEPARVAGSGPEPVTVGGLGSVGLAQVRPAAH